MNTYNDDLFLRNQPLPALPDGNPSVFSTCRCAVYKQTDQDLISRHYASTITASDNAATAIARSQIVEWTGNTADWFRSTLDRTAYTIKMLAEDVEITRRLAMES
ncbi:hypothetical protein [Bifidobacterium myosotis]|uniref:Uncharacterized protein n=1 Tax=Bifidobacterium myosotis TaxID=1630166 RepID=A0A5M9ZN44_9BIFI|nr:hypothetical protein [Bifidobacterium myosotis]KAA8829066.1 hypothetical protein EMO91_03485 [Bifidobacterium myosotis]